jgi:hypothetical protein
MPISAEKKAKIAALAGIFKQRKKDSGDTDAQAQTKASAFEANLLAGPGTWKVATAAMSALSASDPTGACDYTVDGGPACVGGVTKTECEGALGGTFRQGEHC